MAGYTPKVTLKSHLNRIFEDWNHGFLLTNTLIASPDSDRAVNDVERRLADEILHCKG
jgi:hypothetical protein